MKIALDAMKKLVQSGVIFPRGKQLSYALLLEYNPLLALNNTWDDTKWGFDAGQKSYVVETNPKVVDRCIAMTTTPGDIVFDPTCGSGTTALCAEQLGRRWITCDIGRFAIHTARKRLLDISNVKPFVVQNLGKYERQVWQEYQFGDDAQTRIDAYTDFILKLYHAQPLNGFRDLLAGCAGNRGFAGRVDIQHQHIVGVRKGRAELFQQVARAGVTMGLEDYMNAPGTALARCRQGGADLRGMMPVIVHHSDAGG